jgi:hypothetical protein
MRCAPPIWGLSRRREHSFGFAVLLFMKNTLAIARLIFLSTFAAATMLMGCATRKDAHPPAALSAKADDKSTPCYGTTKEITAMTPRTGTFAKRLSAFSGYFMTADGHGFILGAEAGEQWVWHFLSTLREGEKCKLPEAFLDYQAAPQYVTAQEITAMAPCRARLVSRTPCSSYFRTADGKWFGIGDPGSGPQISQFIWSLEDGQTCKFPDAFLRYNRSHQK